MQAQFSTRGLSFVFCSARLAVHLLGNLRIVGDAGIMFLSMIPFCSHHSICNDARTKRKETALERAVEEGARMCSRRRLEPKWRRDHR